MLCVCVCVCVCVCQEVNIHHTSLMLLSGRRPWSVHHNCLGHPWMWQGLGCMVADWEVFGMHFWINWWFCHALVFGWHLPGLKTKTQSPMGVVLHKIWNKQLAIKISNKLTFYWPKIIFGLPLWAFSLLGSSTILARRLWLKVTIQISLEGVRGRKCIKSCNWKVQCLRNLKNFVRCLPLFVSPFLLSTRHTQLPNAWLFLSIDWIFVINLFVLYWGGGNATRGSRCFPLLSSSLVYPSTKSCR